MADYKLGNDWVFSFLCRTDLQDERQINHHGKVRTVSDDDRMTPVENVTQLVKKFLPEEGYDRDLVSIDEKKQDNALKE